MSDPFTVRLATRDDDAAIRELLRACLLPGPICLASAHEPSHFDAIEVMGRSPRVIVGEVGGRIVGTAVMALRHVWVNGRPAMVGFLGGVRLAPEAARFGGLARGVRFFGQLHRAERQVPFYISTILEQEREARTALTSHRAGLPTYHEIGRCRVLAYPLVRQRTPQHGHIQVLPGSDVADADLLACLDRFGPRRHLFPVVTADDLASPHGVLRGLGRGDFLVARDGTALAGALAVWDQDSFRQTVMADYRGPLRRARLLLGARADRLLPAPGQAVATASVACLAVAEDRPDVLRALLRHACARAAERGKAFLMLGLAADDPLLPVATRRLHLTTRSRIYGVEWGEGVDVIRSLGSRPLYLEPGSL